MNSSFEAAERLFKLGEFDEMRRLTDLSDAGIRRLSTAHQLILAQALALTGEVQPAIHVVRFVDTSNCTPLLRSKYHLALGLADERTGAPAEALAHFKTALRFAVAAADNLQIAVALKMFKITAAPSHEAIETQDRMALPEQPLAKMRPEKPSATGYQNPFWKNLPISSSW